MASINWAEYGTDRVWLELWESQHDLRVGEYIEIRKERESALWWCDRVTDVVGQNVMIGETELRSSHHRGRRGKESEAGAGEDSSKVG